jgi:hypothetical protein
VISRASRASKIGRFECRFRFLLCKKSGSLLISGPLPNSDAKGWDLPLGVECDWSIVRKLPNHRLNVDGEERCRRAQVGPVGDKIGSPRPPLTKVSQGEPGVSLTRAHAAQGGVNLGPEQGELGANFCHLGQAY